MNIFLSPDGPFLQYYDHKEGLSYVNDIMKLVENGFNIPFDPSQWRLFCDGGKASLKILLLHNGNKWPPVSVLAHSSVYVAFVMK